jgi:hypothetical protein
MFPKLFRAGGSLAPIDRCAQIDVKYNPRPGLCQMCCQIYVLVEVLLMTNQPANFPPTGAADGHIRTIQKLLAKRAHPSRHISTDVLVYNVDYPGKAYVVVSDLAGHSVNGFVGEYALHALGPIGTDYAIAVQPSDNFALGGVKTAVARVRSSLAAFVQNSDKRIAAGDGHRAVGRIIIHYNYLQRLDRLAGDSF